MWKHSKQTGSVLLVLIAIADGANQDGEYYPSVSSLADKCNMKPRNLQRIVRALEAAGELAVDYFHGADTKRGPTNRYRVVLPDRVQDVAPHIEEGVQHLAPDQPEGVQSPAPVTGEGVQDLAPRINTNTKTDDGGDDARAREGDAPSDDPRSIFTLYHQTFGVMVSGPLLANEFKDIAATYPADWWPDAFKAAALADTKHPNYIRAVLERRKQNGGAPPAPKATNGHARRTSHDSVPADFVSQIPRPPEELAHFLYRTAPPAPRKDRP